MKTLNAMLQTIRQSVLVQAAMACALPLALPVTLPAQNLLPNPGFDTPQAGVTPGTPVSYTGGCGGGFTAAAVWQAWVNTCGSNISTTLEPSKAPGGQQYMMHVVTTGANDGLWVNFAQQPQTLASVWVLVNSGCIGIGTGNHAQTGDTDEMTCVTGRWFQRYHVPNAVSPGNEFVIYSVNNPVFPTNGGADFYLENAEVIAAQ